MMFYYLKDTTFKFFFWCPVLCFPITTTIQYSTLEYSISGDFTTAATFQIPQNSQQTAPLNKWLLCKTRLVSNHQTHRESCRARQKPPGRQTKADPSDLKYTALLFFLDTKGQCVCVHAHSIQSDADIFIVPQMHHSNANQAQAIIDKDGFSG